jgi:hypothetical protein
VARFSSTLGGSVETGHRRLKFLLLGLGLVMLVAAVAAWVGGRIFPGLLALAVAVVAWTVWRLSTDLQPLWLELEAGRLTVQTRRQRIQLTLLDAKARRLTTEEAEHLESLASAGGLVAANGSFDSHKLGEFDLYASNLALGVLIEAADSRFIVSPDDPGGFLAALESSTASLLSSD